jgi:hypothetical protein
MPKCCVYKIYFEQQIHVLHHCDTMTKPLSQIFIESTEITLVHVQGAFLQKILK